MAQQQHMFQTMSCRAWMGKPQSPSQSSYASQQQRSRTLSSSLLWPGYLPSLLSRVQTLVSPAGRQWLAISSALLEAGSLPTLS